MKILLPILIVLLGGAVVAQGLPPPTRTAYKCIVAGKVTYSDEPCLDAKKVDLEPTRGLNKSSGTERIGKDVQRERSQEGLAEAVKPLTGLSPDQFKVEARRHPLSQEAKAQCRQLDSTIPAAETAERAAAPPERLLRQSELLALRKRFKDLRC